MTQRRIVWRWSGPPLIEAEQVNVDTGTRRWTQVIITAQGGIPGVVIIAEREGRIALVKQLRPAVGRAMWELPRGFGEKTDAGASAGTRSRALASGSRELAEETGMLLHGGAYLGSFFPDSGLLSNCVSVVHGFASGPAAGGPREETDDLAWVEIGRIPELISDGTLHDGITLSALALWLLRRPAG